MNIIKFFLLCVLQLSLTNLFGMDGNIKKSNDQSDEQFHDDWLFDDEESCALLNEVMEENEKLSRMTAEYRKLTREENNDSEKKDQSDDEDISDENVSFDDEKTHALLDHCRSEVLSLEVIKQLINGRADINKDRFFGDWGGGTSLHFACMSHSTSLEVITFLIENKAHVDKQNSYDITPLHFICRNQDCSSNKIEIIKFLIESNALVDAQDNTDKTPLHLLCYNTDILIEAIKLLIKEKADINSEDDREQFPLLAMCENEGPLALEGIKFLIEHKADPYQEDGHYFSPLYAVCFHAHSSAIEKIKVLLESNVTINSKNYEGETALHAACSSRELTGHVIRFLIEQKGDLTLQNKKEEGSLTPLQIACKNMESSAVEHIIALISSIINMRCEKIEDKICHFLNVNEKFRAALFCSLLCLKRLKIKVPKYVMFEILKILMVKVLHDFIAMPNKNRITPLMIAQKKNNKPVIHFLEELQEAIRQGYDAVFNFLQRFELDKK